MLYRTQELYAEQKKESMTFGEMMKHRESRQKDKDALEMETPTPKLSNREE